MRPYHYCLLWFHSQSFHSLFPSWPKTCRRHQNEPINVYFMFKNKPLQMAQYNRFNWWMVLRIQTWVSEGGRKSLFMSKLGVSTLNLISKQLCTACSGWKKKTKQLLNSARLESKVVAFYLCQASTCCGRSKCSNHRDAFTAPHLHLRVLFSSLKLRLFQHQYYLLLPCSFKGTEKHTVKTFQVCNN